MLDWSPHVASLLQCCAEYHCLISLCTQRLPLVLVASADMRERFGNVVLIFIVCMRNLAQFNWDLGMY